MIQQVWLRFWQAAANGQLQFRSLEAALSYLRMATVSTVIEAQKLAWRQAREVALVGAAGEEERPDSVPNNTLLQLGSNDTPFDAIQRARFRERCREVIQDPLAYRIFWLRYSLGMAPRDIARQLADAGILIRDRTATPRAVSDLIEQQIARLAIDPEIRDLLQAD
ncbi:MAG: hypothetical protein HGA65_19165 [Oscillochloris sp.]|nr:hypothetical protein [Oscillochloris sp.]